jgi:hypothetical protein
VITYQNSIFFLPYFSKIGLVNLIDRDFYLHENVHSQVKISYEYQQDIQN